MSSAARWIVLLATTSGGLTAIGLFLVRFKRWLKPVVDFFVAMLFLVRGKDAELVQGVEISPRIPGLLEQFTALRDNLNKVSADLGELSTRLGKVEKALSPADGESVHDKLTQIAEAVTHVG